MLLNALLCLAGYPGMTLDELKRCPQIGSRKAGHPEYGFAEAIETTRHGRGHGPLPSACPPPVSGELVDHRTYVASDGDLMEGLSHEACCMKGYGVRFRTP